MKQLVIDIALVHDIDGYRIHVATGGRIGYRSELIADYVEANRRASDLATTLITEVERLTGAHLAKATTRPPGWPHSPPDYPLAPDASTPFDKSSGAQQPPPQSSAPAPSPREDP